MRSLVALLFVSVALAGCVADTPGATDDAETLAATAGAALSLTGTDCEEGGGHSVHPIMLNPLPEPWVPADILDDTGPQFVYSEVPDPLHPIPEKGYTMGNYHATLTCSSWTSAGEPREDIVFGYVGMRVERPEWSDDAPTHHYLVTVVATNDDATHEALMEGGIHAMRATASVGTMASGWLRIQMSTDHNGDYDSLFLPKAFGEMKATHIRLWFQHENDDGTYTPVSLDLRSTEGGEHLVAEAQGYFSHSGTHHHDPLPGAYGHTAAVLHRGFDRVFEWGPATDVRLTGVYDH